MDWMNLPEEYRKNGYFQILPVEYEGNVTYGKGTSLGPNKIIRASSHLEYYDEEFDCEPFKKGIKTQQALDLEDVNPSEMVENVSSKVQNTKGFPLIIGGDHSITIGAVKGFREKEDESFSVLVLDAHSDFRDRWNNSKYNHACVSKRISEENNTGIIGVRSQDISEKESINSEDNTRVLYSHEFSIEETKEIISDLDEKVYVSIDCDVFDPSLISCTGTPEPGGLDWRNVIDVLKIVFEEKKVIGADIVEFSPSKDRECRSESYTLARLAYKLMSLETIK